MLVKSFPAKLFELGVQSVFRYLVFATCKLPLGRLTSNFVSHLRIVMFMNLKKKSPCVIDLLMDSWHRQSPCSYFKSSFAVDLPDTSVPLAESLAMLLWWSSVIHLLPQKACPTAPTPLWPEPSECGNLLSHRRQSNVRTTGTTCSSKQRK